MRNTLFLALALAVLTACNDASSKINNSTTENGLNAESVAAAGTPAFTFEEETWNFGQIKEGEVAEHIFKFKNTGNAPLIISNAQGSCGCTVPQFPREPIAPGNTGEIKVSFNSQGRAGSQNKRVTINANTIPNVYTLEINAEVLADPNAPKKVESAEVTVTPN